MQDRQSSPPQSARKKPFPLIARSRAMKHLLEEATTRAERHYVMPLVLSANRIELPSFIQAVLARRRLTGSHRIIDEVMPHPEMLDSSSIETVIFMKGDRISGGIQQAFAKMTYRHLRGVIAIIENSPVASGTDPVEALDKLGWSREFLETACTHRMSWPTWAERRADHAGICTEIYRRLRMPDGSRKPGYDQNVIGFLSSCPTLKGTEHVELLLRAGLKHYATSGGTGLLTVSHLLSSDMLRDPTLMPGESPKRRTAERRASSAPPALLPFGKRESRHARRLSLLHFSPHHVGGFLFLRGHTEL